MFTDTEVLALGKLVTKKTLDESRGKVEPGEFDFDFTVHVKGTAKVGNDSTKKPTVSIPIKEVLKLFVAYSGVTGKHALKAMERAVTDALIKREDNTAKGAIDEADSILKAGFAKAESIINETIENLPRTPVKGQVRMSFEEIEKVETDG